jgi:nucleotide-binding universal stress UspA family protein
MGISVKSQARRADQDYFLERILVPLDGSAAAEKAISLVRSFGPTPAVHVVLVRIVASEALKESARTYLHQIAAVLASNGLAVETVVQVGPVSDGLLRVAAKENADLLAMSTHGGDTSESEPWGAIAQQLFAASPIPILAIPAHAPVGGPSKPFRTMLVPIDTAESSETVARIAAGFAVSCRIDLAVLLAKVPAVETGRGEAEERVDAESRLGRWADVFERKRIPTVRLAHEGDPVRELLHSSTERNADVVVLPFGAQTRPFAESVLKESPLPVLAIRMSD